MGFSTEEITAVRALPVVLAVHEDGAWQSDPGFAEIVFASSAEGKFHQVYVDGELAAATLWTEQRSLVVAAPEHGASAIEVLAVDPDDRLTDFSESLTGYEDGCGSRARLTWYGGRYLDDHLDHFDAYGGLEGAVDYSQTLNAEPVPAFPDGVNLGGFGRGGFGRSAMAYAFTTAKHFAGRYTFEVVAVDGAGNATGGAPARVEIELAGFARPPSDLRVAAYEPATRTATLQWAASPDLDPL